MIRSSHERRVVRGQALVEFSLAITVFLALLMGIVDFGRAIYLYNSVSQAAQAIARVTSVHPGTDPTTPSGWSPEMQAVVSTQQGLIPGLLTPTITCFDASGNTVAPCQRSSQVPVLFVKVQTAAPFTIIADPLGALLQFTAGPSPCTSTPPYPAFCFQSSSTVAIQ